MADRQVLRVPDPSLIVLVGASGAGKSTFAARWFAPAEILSSDALREHIAGDAADQRATRPAFGVLHRALSRRLAQGKLTVVDATNVRAHARRALTRRASFAGVPAIAIVLDLTPALVLARNALRAGRVVPSAVVANQLRELASCLHEDGLAADGFTTVVTLRDPDAVAALVLERHRPGHASQSEAAGQP